MNRSAFSQERSAKDDQFDLQVVRQCRDDTERIRRDGDRLPVPQRPILQTIHIKVASLVGKA
jgi:hypothetical protein